MLRPLAIRHYISTMPAKGISVARILDGADLTVADIADETTLIQPEQHRRVLANLCSLGPESISGFDAGLSMTMANLGVLGYAAMTSETIRDTAHLWCRYSKTLTGFGLGLEVVAEEGEEDVTLGGGFDREMDQVGVFQTEEFLGMTKVIDQPLVRDVPVIKEITLAYPAPAHHARYQQIFQCPIHFDAGRTTVRLPKWWFDKKLITSNPEFNRICVEHCDEVVSRTKAKQTTQEHLQRFFASCSSGIPTLDEAAATLKVSVRTLRRKLQNEETSYTEQLESFRVRRAKQLLKFSSLSPKEVAYRLGFSECSAFRHAFKTWTGQTVGEYKSSIGCY